MDGMDVDALRSINRARVPVQRRAVDDEIDNANEFDTDLDTDLDADGPGSRPDEPVELTVGDGLSERERQVLAFERQWWRRAGAKEQAIRELFGISSTRYYQLLNGLLDNGAALAYDPVLVKRLRRLRASRTRSRTAGRVA